MLTRRAFLQTCAAITAACALPSAAPPAPAPLVALQVRPWDGGSPGHTASLPPTLTLYYPPGAALPAMKPGDPMMPRPYRADALVPGDGVLARQPLCGDPVVAEEVLVVCRVLRV